MAVFVDDMKVPYGRMVMCHMVADTAEELLAMADKIGVDRKWIQDAGDPHEHFDIAMSKRALAVQYGARECTMFQLIDFLDAKEASGASLPADTTPADDSLGVDMEGR